MAEYHNQSKLRFWCQMVLPLVYDDSLSYMELLNKVVTYLNNCIQDVGNCETNIESLLEAFVNLQDYVNEIAEDISPLIEEKIDEMIESGELGEILADTLATVVSPEYDSNESYVPLNYAIKDGQLYCCTANTTGEWDNTKWRETTVGDELNTLMQKVYSLNAGDIEYNSSETYNNATVGKELSNLNTAITNIQNQSRMVHAEYVGNVAILANTNLQRDIMTGINLYKGTYILSYHQTAMSANDRNTPYYYDNGRVYQSTAANRLRDEGDYTWTFTIDHDISNSSIGIWLANSDVEVTYSNIKLYALLESAFNELNGAITPIVNRFPTTNYGSVAALVAAITATPNLTVGMCSGDGVLSQALGNMNAQCSIVYKYISTANAINYTCYTNVCETFGRINTSDGTVTSIDAKTNSDLGSLTSGTVAVSANATTTINVPNNARAFLIAFGSAGFLVSVNVTSAGVVSYQEYWKASNITFSTGTRQFKVTNSSNANLTCGWFDFMGKNIT